MPERDANQLAADVRASLDAVRAYGHTDEGYCLACDTAPDAALDELVALVGTLQQERDGARLALESNAPLLLDLTRDKAELVALVGTLQQTVRQHISWADRREGMVIAYDDTGLYVGCIGADTWRWLLEHPEMDATALGTLQRDADRDRDSANRYSDMLDEQIALVGTLQQEREQWKAMHDAAAGDWREEYDRRKAAEAALAEAEAARENWKGLAEDRGAALTNMTEWHNEATRALAEANAKVKFCPYCGGAFVPEAGYEGPCAGCAKHLAAEAALAEATKQNDRLRLTEKYLMEFDADTTRLAQALATTRQALAWYADESTYVEGDEPHPTEFATYVTPIDFDKGDRARRALTDTGGDTP